MTIAEVCLSRDTRKLQEYFGDAHAPPSNTPVGMEVETSFVDSAGRPISIVQSQQIFKTLLQEGWQVVQMKGSLLSELKSPRGDKLLYEVGRQNLEIATVPATSREIVNSCRAVLETLYEAAALHGAYPSFQPIIDTKEDLLVIPDDRDAVWDAIDGREALKMIAWMSAVQFTVEIPLENAVSCLNNLGRSIGVYLADYPQDSIWRDYIRISNACYRPDRYGGPLLFEDVADYCEHLAKHAVVQGKELVPYERVDNLDIPLYLRSIWWYFRLRRYGERLCIEVRPLARRDDSQLGLQLSLVLETLAL